MVLLSLVREIPLWVHRVTAQRREVDSLKRIEACEGVRINDDASIDLCSNRQQDFEAPGLAQKLTRTLCTTRVILAGSTGRPTNPR